MEKMQGTGYELAGFLPRERKREPPEIVKITITVPREDVEAIDEAVKLSGLVGDTPTAYGRATFMMAAKRARAYIRMIKQKEERDEH